MSRIHDISVRILKQECAQGLADELHRRGWLLSVLSLEGRMVWLQATKAGRRLEAEVRGMPDLVNACGMLQDMVCKHELSNSREVA